jgi:hypothetical protein
MSRLTNVLCTNAGGECPKDECALHERRRRMLCECPMDEGELLREGNWHCEGPADEGLRLSQQRSSNYESR